jgi:uncharacterized protein (TIGR00251 family)
MTDTARLAIKVVPGSSRNTVAGWLGDALRLRVTAPPDKGKANAAVVKLIAETLDIPAASIAITKGSTRARKTVEISGYSDTDIRRRLELNQVS